ncbi:MAG: hypothetical protein H6765_00880 [Candidatus Peribacteria bacterium]|nr:MAG: hypothetical protein H6765_00880 [Candidatus Peribacteria bacterium]
MEIVKATLEDVDYIVERLIATYAHINETVGMQLFHAKQPLLIRHVQKRLQDEHSNFDYFVARDASGNCGVVHTLREDMHGQILILDGNNKTTVQKLLAHALQFFKEHDINTVQTEQTPASLAHQVLQAAGFACYMEQMQLAL